MSCTSATGSATRRSRSKWTSASLARSSRITWFSRNRLSAMAGSTPGIDQFQPATDKIAEVSRRQGGAAGSGNGGDARVGFGYRPTYPAPGRGDVRELTSRRAVEGKDPTHEVLGENQAHDGFQGLPPSTLGQKGDSVKQLRLGDR